MIMSTNHAKVFLAQARGHGLLTDLEATRLQEKIELADAQTAAQRRRRTCKKCNRLPCSCGAELY